MLIRTHGSILLVIGMLLFAGSLRADAANCSAAKNVLVAQLKKMSHVDLYLGEDTVLFIHEVWSKEENRCAVNAILSEKKESRKVRFFAAEILLENSDSIPANIDKTELGKLYAYAIRRNVTGDLNNWGYFVDNDIGPVGRHLIRIGKPAVPALSSLLNKRWGMVYSGSKSADVGNSFHVRKKDVAAFFIIQILGLPYEWKETRAERDVIIREVKKKVKTL